MGITSDPAPELEEERQRLVEKRAAEHGVGWSEPFRPGSFGCHELLDRTSLLADSL